MKFETTKAKLGVCLLLLVVYAWGMVTYKHEIFPLGAYRTVKAWVVGTKTTQENVLDGESLLDALHGGGYLIYFRHTHRDDNTNHEAFATAMSLAANPIENPEIREPLYLAKSGREDAWLMGELMRGLAIPIGKIQASPIPRCVETANIAFGRVDEIDINLVYLSLFLKSEVPSITENLLTLLGQKPEAGKNRVIVGHGKVLTEIDILEVHLEEAEAAILKSDADGNIEFIAKMKLADWADLLERKPILKPSDE